MSYCKVRGCRHPESHNVRGHKCGKCSKFKHGQYECGHPERITILNTQIIQLPIEIHCQAPGCRGRHTHTSSGHHCYHCGNRHFESTCSTKSSHGQTHGQTHPASDEYVHREARNLFGNRDGKIYGEIYGGMGCIWYVKRDSLYSPIRTFFMHSDSWGQYGSGPNLDHRPQMESFIAGYTHI
jgi:hypothetical protein